MKYRYAINFETLMTYLDVQLDWRVILYFVLGERDDEMVGEGFNSRGLSSLSLLTADLAFARWA